ncbi:hypothetical protein EDC96DRAFT_431245, partial [Choanephora cucurbitarum]
SEDEQNSQACAFCFDKISLALKIVEKDVKESLETINDTFVCNNKTCILDLAEQLHKHGDSLS